jgi:hypothetical protein
MSLRLDSRIACRRQRSAALFALCWLGLSGCKIFDSTCLPDDRSCLGGGVLRSGQSCVRTGDCASGLDCEKSVCVYTHDTAKGQRCFVTNECAANLYCAEDLTCKSIASDPKGANETCGSTAECAQGLVCDIQIDELFSMGPYGLVPDECHDQLNSDTTSDECKLPRKCLTRGKAEIGQTCKSGPDCLPGLLCGPNPLDSKGGNICIGGIKFDVEPVSIPFWNGVQCPDDSKDAVAYFEVPRSSGASNGDFYRLPFPNDIRRHDGHVDMSGHPTPPADLQPETAAAYIDAVGTLDGFSTNPVVLFRFSKAIDPNDRNGDTLRLVDVTPSSPEYGQAASIQWSPSDLSSHYICPHWFGLSRPLGSPLRPNTTYAALITTGVHPKDGGDFARSPDLTALLQPDAPRDSTLAAAWTSYAPLRRFLTDGTSDLPAEQLLNAAVFTTQDTGAVVSQLRAAVEADGPAAIKDLTLCDSGVVSPCQDNSGRGACLPAPSDAFYELHGHVSLPSFQNGTPPFDTAADGGEIALGSDGNPRVVGHVDVCFSISLPKRPAPANGFPLLIFGHATGGAFTDPLGNSGLSAWAAAATATPSAVLAIDLPENGSRRGASTRPPEDLYFNFSNPKSTRGNALQGAADLIGLSVLAGQTIPRGELDIPADIKFDPSRVVMFGHQQGATHISLMIGYEARVRAALLSGIGGHYASSLLLRVKPVDFSSLLPFALFDPNLDDGKLVGAEFNPMLALLQDYLDAADPINFARYLYLEPPESAANGHDVFMTYGLFDSFAPEETQQYFAEAGELSAASRDLANKFPTIQVPVSANVMPGNAFHTVALRTYDPMDNPVVDGKAQDGDFVAFATKLGVADVKRFLDAALNGETPAIGQADDE